MTMTDILCCRMECTMSVGPCATCAIYILSTLTSLLKRSPVKSYFQMFHDIHIIEIKQNMVCVVSGVLVSAFKTSLLSKAKVVICILPKKHCDYPYCSLSS